MNITILTQSDTEYVVDSDDITVKTNGLLVRTFDNETAFFPWSHIKVVGTDDKDEDAVREFFYNF